MNKAHWSWFIPMVLVLLFCFSKLAIIRKMSIT